MNTTKLHDRSACKQMQFGAFSLEIMEERERRMSVQVAVG